MQHDWSLIWTVHHSLSTCKLGCLAGFGAIWLPADHLQLGKAILGKLACTTGNGAVGPWPSTIRQQKVQVVLLQGSAVPMAHFSVLTGCRHLILLAAVLNEPAHSQGQVALHARPKLSFIRCAKQLPNLTCQCSPRSAWLGPWPIHSSGHMYGRLQRTGAPVRQDHWPELDFAVIHEAV